MKLKRITYHILFWVSFSFIYPILTKSTSYLDSYLNNFLSVVIGLPFFLVGLYYITYYLIPTILTKKRNYVAFSASYLISIFFLILHEILIKRYIFFPLIEPDYVENYKDYILTLENVTFVVIITQTKISIFIALKYFKKYIENYLKNEKLKSKAVEIELNTLKSQIHPHFLFNTLNNIYSLSIEGKSKAVSDSIAKLSDILRFTLYECRKKFISLEDEISIIKKYINLEKLRYSNLKLDISFPDNTKNFYVIPLLLFTFVENGFKHGISESIENKWLYIKLEVLRNDLRFHIKNSKCNIQKKKSLTENGLGLQNAFRRLDLYFGKGNYLAQINDKPGFYEVFLQYKMKKV